jgi:hypothetical protein
MTDLENLATQVELIEGDSDAEELEKGDRIIQFLEINKGLHDRI